MYYIEMKKKQTTTFHYSLYRLEVATLERVYSFDL